MKTKTILIIVGILIIICCCLLIIGIGVSQTQLFHNKPYATVQVNINLIRGQPPQCLRFEVKRDPIDPGANETLKTLEEGSVPINDPVNLAERFFGLKNIPSVIPSPIPHLGEKRQFWVNNSDTDATFQFTAECKLVGDHAYWWIEDGVNYNQVIWPKSQMPLIKKYILLRVHFFGSEWSPGIDGDPKLYIFYAKGLGSGVGDTFLRRMNCPRLCESVMIQTPMKHFLSTRMEKDWIKNILTARWPMNFNT